MNAIDFINEMDYLAQVHTGNLMGGYDTCTPDEKQEVIKLLLESINIEK